MWQCKVCCKLRLCTGWKGPLPSISGLSCMLLDPLAALWACLQHVLIGFKEHIPLFFISSNSIFCLVYSHHFFLYLHIVKRLTPVHITKDEVLRWQKMFWILSSEAAVFLQSYFRFCWWVAAQHIVWSIHSICPLCNIIVFSKGNFICSFIMTCIFHWIYFLWKKTDLEFKLHFSCNYTNTCILTYLLII